MLTISRRVRRIALVLPLLAAAGCATGSQRPASSPADDHAASAPVRVASAGAAPVVLDHTVGGDVRLSRDARGHIAPAAEVRTGEARQISTRTKALIVVGLAAAAVAAVLLFGVHSECDCIHP